jgi:LacI family transcriptional regulator
MPNSSHRATIDDVAALAGVSIKTVSRVVNNEPNVRAATRAKVERAIAELSYRPNLSARNLASQRARLITLIYDDPSAYEIPSAGYVMNMQAGVLAACRTADYRLVIHPCDYRADASGAELQAMIEHARPQGIVLAAPLSNMPAIVRAIAATGTPMVRLSPGSRSSAQYSVATNDREISTEMTRYLASLGHRSIAFIKGHPSHKAVDNRYLGYLDGLKKSGLDFSGRLVEAGDNSFGSGEDAGRRLLQLASPPTAVFSANDDMAAGVVRAAALLGIDIPGRLSVVGCDDVSLARQLRPTLTTIRQPLLEMAQRAALVLIENAGNDSQLQGSEIIPATIVVRESTAPPHR